MSAISLTQFQAFTGQGYNHIPVTRELLVDMDTPLSAYYKLAMGPYSYLLESVQGGEKWGRYSIIGLPAKTIFRVDDHKIIVEEDSEIISSYEAADPLAEIEKFQQQYRVPRIEGLPRFTGGLVGYFGYDTIRYIEPRLRTTNKEDQLGCPDILLLVSDRIVVFDNVSNKLMLIVHAQPECANAYQNAQHELDKLEQILLTKLVINKPCNTPRTVNESDFISGFTQTKYEQMANRIKRYIIDGDVMQVVLSQRLSIPYHAPPLYLYRALRTLNPSPYMYYFNMDDFYVVGTSPEILVRKEESTVTVRPIAGTRPRGNNEEDDLMLERELLSDPKEIAEHLMLIDLGRNDISRVCKTGSVKLTEKMITERYSHVMHIVSNVVGKIKDGVSAIDVLRATFPAGTVSGAPKIRAMEIIDELEPVKRGIYAGAVGYLSWAGNMDTAIAIRTAVIKNNLLHIQAGGGVVADSVPLNEWKESMDKGRVIFRAVTMAEKSLI